MLLTNLLSIVVIVDDIVQDGRWIHVFLVSEHEVRHELLEVRSHDCALLLARQDLELFLLGLPFVRVLRHDLLRKPGLLSVLIRDICI